MNLLSKTFLIATLSSGLCLTAVAQSKIKTLGGMISETHNPNSGHDSNTRNSLYYDYRETIRELGRIGREEAVTYLIKSIEAQEAKLKSGIFKAHNANDAQRLLELRTEAVKALGAIGTKNPAARALLERISKEKKNPFNTYDGYDGFKAQKTAKASLEAIDNNSFVKMPVFIRRNKEGFLVAGKEYIRKDNKESSGKDISSLVYSTDVDKLKSDILKMNDVDKLKELAYKTIPFTLPMSSDRNESMVFGSGTISGPAINRLESLQDKDDNAILALLSILKDFNNRGRSQNVAIAEILSTPRDISILKAFSSLSKHKDEVVRASIITQIGNACAHNYSDFSDICEDEMIALLEEGKKDEYKIVREAAKKSLEKIARARKKTLGESLKTLGKGVEKTNAPKKDDDSHVNNRRGTKEVNRNNNQENGNKRQGKSE